MIAVNVSTPPLKREEITSSLSVTVLLLNFLGIATVEAQLKSLGSRDVLIAPDLGNISAGSFEQAAAAIKIGEDATRAKSDQLKHYTACPRSSTRRCAPSRLSCARSSARWTRFASRG